MSAFPIMLTVLCVLAIAYRYYSAFIASKVLALDNAAKTPAHELNDGQNYVPTNRWVLFGHHFAAITGAGPLIGPVLAAQFGFLPGLLWILIGVVLAGAVHDLVILTASVRRRGRSLAEIARTEVGPVSGFVCALAVLFIVVVALAGLGLVVVNALAESAWGTFTVAMTVPIALLMSFYMYRFRAGAIAEATFIGVVLLVFCVVIGKPVAESSVGNYFYLSRSWLIFAVAGYGFIASVLPVWMLLCPRDYLSSFMKLGTIVLLVIGVLIVRPELRMPALTQYVHGGGPIIGGKLFPFVFITVACGAISGFHSLVASGTTPKMIDRESDIRPIGYGAMLLEGLVGITSLIAASALFPGDYFAINVPPEKFASLGLEMRNLPELAQEIGEQLQGRTGGGVSLAVGMAQIFSSLPGMRSLVSYWYHFAIMFEALFILTTIDTGTRVARFLLQEFLGRFYSGFDKADAPVASVIATAIVVTAWAYFIYTGSISTIWPMFGIANQLLAVVALAVGTTTIINSGKLQYFWVTALPMLFVATTTISAGYLAITVLFLPQGNFQGYLNSALTAIMLLCVFIVLGDCGLKWQAKFRRRLA
ncbi:MAG: carbon starvation protein A [Acidobacteriota bacterium]|nr:carbon starvation protein A [Blastocatellia bacterium]MDW8411422.1 carbon starvation protein A [Acidobacteriota bacterium]